MFEYIAKYSRTFNESVKKFVINKKTRRMLGKDILFVLEKPYWKAEKVEGYFRKNVCAGRFRIFYSVNEKNKEVYFHLFRLKDKQTYKNL